MRSIVAIVILAASITASAAYAYTTCTTRCTDTYGGQRCTTTCY